VLAADALRRQLRSELLPQVSAGLLVTEQQLSLAALGFGGRDGFPSVVGPFHYFDLRAGVAQSVFDLTKRRNYRSGQENLRSTRFAAQDARDLIVLAVTGGYLQIVAAQARVAAVEAQVATGQATYQQARDRQAAGVAPLIDVTRTQVELQTQQQRLIAVQNDLAKLKIAMDRLIGLPAGQDITLTDTLPFAPLTSVTLDQALKDAYAHRADLKAAESQVRAAELARAGAAAQRYPTAQFAADYGVIGQDPTNSHGTFTVTGAVRMEIFTGGRIAADVEAADASLRQRRAEYEDLGGQVDAQIRSAFLDLTAAANQVAVAESNRKLAAQTLTQARDRFAAGVTDSLEVVQAQEAVAAAEQDYIAALYSHNLAKASLARAMGQADANIKTFLARP
jgi:outer membrane protein TolC